MARGTASDEVFVAVTNEASALFGDLPVALMLYDDTGAVVVATCHCPAPVGLHVPFSAGTAVDRLYRTGRPAHVDTYEGTPMAGIAREAGIASTTAVPITVEGRVRATLVSSNTLPATRDAVEARLTQFAELAAVAIANAETRAKLTASRARVVATADETRRRLQRDVHDGAQQRLVHTIIALKLARDALATGSSATDLVDEALANAERANAELRDLVHGILPGSLTRGGLRAGIESLVADIAVPVDVGVTAPRLPAATETTAYFVVAEALTNVVKHAGARRARVQVDLDGRRPPHRGPRRRRRRRGPDPGHRTRRAARPRRRRGGQPRDHQPGRDRHHRAGHPAVRTRASGERRTVAAPPRIRTTGSRAARSTRGPDRRRSARRRRRRPSSRSCPGPRAS